MKLHQLRAMLAISESGSIQEASRLLHISQPALSKGIKELEAELGVPLLIRSNRGITVTEYGERLVRRARLILEEVRRAREEIETLKGTMDGKVAIGVSPVTPGAQFVASLNRYRKRYPQVRVQIHELRPSKLMEGLREGQLDLVLTSQPAIRNSYGFHWTELYAQPTVLAVRKGHPLGGARRSLAELREHEWLLQDSLEQSRVGLMFDHYRVEPPERIIECASVVLFSELALNTDAISYWSQRLLERVQTLGQALEVLDLAEQIPPMNISLVCRDQELMTREAKALSDELVYAYKSPHAPQA
ncbi:MULTISPECIES: LysR substrate-binding domain-containing protein [Pseudomonas]|uniref:LysR family transcriptional regulator n=1 Tax=Pseudomonas TaxID=286 RepID=UPI001C81FAC4|nr:MULTISPECIES: LysR substrate-binding domain-containing protein [Pseudomonas]MDG9926614.1 LysR substrate-binding domain-containing protein [Pseudomonas sp. GD04042]MDH0482317.1 LysR substrate-binding domain-containing protein [Pseudomonas sp. GD04015]MDH0603752.1 LysR substrate-binding domain-containing protein [Pseudomonas sp. GD03869]MDH0893590.1 LysR substrate-binding domain-containing protein [Pseudomonas sp. GD03875]MDH1065759.1 LysR substrate-binding domain-containing protein [Pseudomo